MEFKDILVHIDDSPHCAVRLELAARIAHSHNAWLTGLYLITHPYYASQGEQVELKEQEARRRFQALLDAGTEGEFRTIDWGIAGDTMVEMLIRHAHPRDLVIVGQTGHERLQGEVPPSLPERTVLGSGRPVLVVPCSGTFTTVGTRVVVAWKPGRATARAIHDAMPFLVRAHEVLLVALNTQDEPRRSEPAEGDEMLRHLKRHGVLVTHVILETGDVPVDSVLMNFAWEHGCDLLVMGVYAQTVRGALTVSPVAKRFFEQMTLPVLMSG